METRCDAERGWRKEQREELCSRYELPFWSPVHKPLDLAASSSTPMACLKHASVVSRCCLEKEHRPSAANIGAADAHAGPDANSNISKISRMLWEGMGFGWAEVSYSGVAYPLVDEGMKHAMKLRYKRVIVFPYFLFTGILVRRIYAWADEAAAANPDVEVLNASHLNDHTQLLDCFVDRIEEALDGSNAMNCLLCKYREQVIRYEGDVGTAQAGHHQHVSATGTDGHGAHDHDNPHKD